jgi:LacI family transcriptional regulator
MSKAATIRDVAKAAGLSVTAVSRYLNRDIVLPETSSSRILRAVRELNYQPNRLARNLSRGESRMIGLVIPDIVNPFFAILAAAVESMAFKAGYGVLLCNTQNDRHRELTYLQLLTGRQLDGILFLTSHAEDPELVRVLQSSRNVVLIDEDVAGVSAPRIFCENRNGGYLAATYLVERGHTRIGFIGGPHNLLSTQERFAGFQTALGEHGIKLDPTLVRFGPYTSVFGREATLELLAQRRRPSAIFASSDYVAVGVLNAAHSRELEVPADLSLVGFDDIPIAELLRPALTTVRQSADELGRRGAEILFQILAGQALDVLEIRLPVALIPRDSVRPLRRAARSGLKLRR